MKKILGVIEEENEFKFEVKLLEDDGIHTICIEKINISKSSEEITDILKELIDRNDVDIIVYINNLSENIMFDDGIPDEIPDFLKPYEKITLPSLSFIQCMNKCMNILERWNI